VRDDHQGVAARGAAACRAALAEARERTATDAPKRVWEPLPALVPPPALRRADRPRTNSPVGMPAYVEPTDTEIPPGEEPPAEDWRDR